MKRTYTIRAKTFFGIREILLAKGLKPSSAEYRRAYRAAWAAQNRDKLRRNNRRHYYKSIKAKGLKRRALRFTVLLLYPDYLAATFGHETYLAHVLAHTALDAIRIAQRDRFIRAREGHASDWHPLACFRGHVHDCNPLDA